MARAQRQKQERRSTIAFAASQPLFDAVRAGIANTDQQKMNLSVARDLVPNVHAALGNDAPTKKRDQERYLDSAVMAYRLAMDTYIAIFDELGSITAAYRTESGEAEEGHEMFTKMAACAKAAKRVSMKYTTQDDLQEHEARKEKQPRQSSAPSNDAKPGDNVDPTPADPLLLAPLNGNGKRPAPTTTIDDSPAPEPKLPPTKKQRSMQGRLLWVPDEEKPRMPSATLDGSGKKAWKHEKLRQKREKRRPDEAAAELKGQMMPPLRKTLNPEDAPQRVENSSKPLHDRDFVILNRGVESGAKQNLQPKVEYEDVSHLVEERLKAKEARKKARKEEKKRKRPSEGSSDILPPVTTAEKHRTKRLRGADEGKYSTGITKTEKRLAEDVGQGEAGERKKRKKTMT